MVACRLAQAEGGRDNIVGVPRRTRGRIPRATRQPARRINIAPGNMPRIPVT